MEIAATFTQGTDSDIAAVEVQNRLKIVESRLPESVRREGVFVEKSSNNIQAMISLSSTGSLNDTELGEWASARIIPELKRVKGVGRVELFGAETSMRIWPDPEKLEALGLTPTDIVNAVAAQSERIIIGDIGGASVPESAPINAGVVAEDAFRTPEEFASIALRTLSDGSSVKLGDVARVELGANSYAFFSRWPPEWPSRWLPAPMPWKPWACSRPKWMNCPGISRPESPTRFPMKPPTSWKSPSGKSFQPCWKPSCWCSWSCSCSSRTSGPP